MIFGREHYNGTGAPQGRRIDYPFGHIGTVPYYNIFPPQNPTEAEYLPPPGWYPSVTYDQETPAPRESVPQTSSEILREHRLMREDSQREKKDVQKPQNHPLSEVFTQNYSLPGFYPQDGGTNFPQISMRAAQKLGYNGYPCPLPIGYQFPTEKKKKKKFSIRIRKKRKNKVKKKKNKKKIKIKFHWKSKRKLKKKHGKLGYPYISKKEKKLRKKAKRRQKMLKMRRKLVSKLAKIDKAIHKFAQKSKILIFKFIHFICIFLGLGMLFLGLFTGQAVGYLSLSSGALLLAIGLVILSVKTVRWIEGTQDRFRAKEEREKWTFINNGVGRAGGDIYTIA